MYIEHNYNSVKEYYSKEQFDDYVAQEKEIIDLVISEGVSSRNKLYKYDAQPLLWAQGFFEINKNEEYEKLVKSVFQTKKYQHYGK